MLRGFGATKPEQLETEGNLVWTTLVYCCHDHKGTVEMDSITFVTDDKNLIDIVFKGCQSTYSPEGFDIEALLENYYNDGISRDEG